MSRRGGEGSDVYELTTGWEFARCSPGEHADPRGIESLAWRTAVVPGTVALALLNAGDPIHIQDLDAYDWWFRTRFEAPPSTGDEQLTLEFGGIATIADVFLDGRLLFHSESMFESYEHDVGEMLSNLNELTICCRALAPELARRRRPRARWRTRLVADGNLRFFRTMLLGRAPGFAPGPPVVGPWRSVVLHRRQRPVVADPRVRARVVGNHGAVTFSGQISWPIAEQGVPRAQLVVSGPGGDAAADMSTRGQGNCVEASGEIEVADVERWWPHTHGKPVLYEVAVVIKAEHQSIRVPLGRVGFRELCTGQNLERDGIQLEVNGVSVFVRGAVWTPGDLARTDTPTRPSCRARSGPRRGHEHGADSRHGVL